VKWIVGINGLHGRPFKKQPNQTAHDLIFPAIKAYFHANNGKAPESLSELERYVVSPEQKAALAQLRQAKSRNNPAGSGPNEAQTSEQE
jgi:hypothetical protein